MAVTIIPRSDWGAAQASKPETGSWTPWLGGVVIHHHGPGTGYPRDPHIGCYGQVLDVQRDAMTRDIFEWAVEDTKYDDIPYNYLVCQHGFVFEGRGPRVRSGANGTAPNANKDNFAVMGMIELGDQPSPAMMTAIRELIAHLRQHEQAGPLVRGHRDVREGTECPGNLYPHVQSGALEPGPITPPNNGLIIYPRSRWGARPARVVTPVALRDRTGFTVHYSAGPTTQTPLQIQNYHMNSNGWDDIGYNFLIDRNGLIYEGRGWVAQGAHASGYNVTHIGACFIGRDGEATPRALSAIRSLYNEANQLTGRTLERTWHGGLPGQSTQCPGAALRAWVQGGMQGDVLPITDGTGGGSGGMTAVRGVGAQQLAVNQLGYTPLLAVDGIWGPQTDAGVRWLQTRVGVSADGLWGPQTEAAYRTHIGQTPGGGMTSVRHVRFQQGAVNQLGYTPRLTVDGIWGPQTDAGVRWLQTRLGVSADGLWGTQTDAAYSAYLDGGARLTVDGSFGPTTIAATQRAIGATPDGIWGPGSIRALQNHLNTWSAAGLAVDGAMGAATVRALQRHLNNMIRAGLTVDGGWGPTTIRALQTTLNLAKL